MDAPHHRRTSISAGVMIYRLLYQNKEIHDIVTKIFPVSVSDAKLPYIYYRRAKGECIPVKNDVGADSSIVEVRCCAEDYESAVALAEMVRFTLDHKTASSPDMRMRSCTYLDSEDLWEDDAHVVSMLFNVSIG